jgi:hypothetical protein
LCARRSGRHPRRTRGAFVGLAHRPRLALVVKVRHSRSSAVISIFPVACTRAVEAVVPVVACIASSARQHGQPLLVGSRHHGGGGGVLRHAAGTTAGEGGGASNEAGQPTKRRQERNTCDNSCANQLGGLLPPAQSGTAGRRFFFSIGTRKLGPCSSCEDWVGRSWVRSRTKGKQAAIPVVECAPWRKILWFVDPLTGTIW